MLLTQGAFLKNLVHPSESNVIFVMIGSMVPVKASPIQMLLR